MTTATVHQLNVSKGGVPKKRIEEARITTGGLGGDRHAKPGIHGGPYRAVSLFPLELIEKLSAEGHPISPGSVGENVTTCGLDWSKIRPGVRLGLGSEVVLEITSFADPCTTIAGSFSDGNMNRLNHKVAPDQSRVYAQVLEEGTVRPGDAIEIEEPRSAGTAAGEGVRAIAQIAVPVSDLERGIAFYRDALGATYQMTVDPPGLAMLDVNGVRLMLDGPAHSPDARPGATTIYFDVEDIDKSYEAMRARGVDFDVPPLLQYTNGGVEGWMAFFEDPDGNRLALVSHRPASQSR